jgi:pSer/pThr/pTyr-binding forkhead associated (FHA) protein
LPTGRFTLASDAVAGVEERAAGGRAAPPPTLSAQRHQLVLEVNGTRHPLQPPGLVIGRGTEADLRINDPGISRRHAEIRVEAAGPALRIQIVDLGSTNGIIVNGHKVREAPLQEGSRIEIGSTRMLVHAPAGR